MLYLSWKNRNVAYNLMQDEKSINVCLSHWHPERFIRERATEFYEKWNKEKNQWEHLENPSARDREQFILLATCANGMIEQNLEKVISNRMGTNFSQSFIPIIKNSHFTSLFKTGITVASTGAKTPNFKYFNSKGGTLDKNFPLLAAVCNEQGQQTPMSCSSLDKKIQQDVTHCGDYCMCTVLAAIENNISGSEVTIEHVENFIKKYGGIEALRNINLILSVRAPDIPSDFTKENIEVFTKNLNPIAVDKINQHLTNLGVGFKVRKKIQIIAENDNQQAMNPNPLEPQKNPDINSANGTKKPTKIRVLADDSEVNPIKACPKEQNKAEPFLDNYNLKYAQLVKKEPLNIKIAETIHKNISEDGFNNGNKFKK